MFGVLKTYEDLLKKVYRMTRTKEIEQEFIYRVFLTIQEEIRCKFICILLKEITDYMKEGMLDSFERAFFSFWVARRAHAIQKVI